MRAKAQLNGRKTQPNSLSIVRANPSLRPPCSRSSSALSAGDSVSELKALIAVEIAIVIANCL